MNDQEKSAWVSDYAQEGKAQQNQNNGIRENMSGYASLTRPTDRPSNIENIPTHWSQIKLGEIAEQITKGTTPTTAGHQYLESGINFVKVENINQYGIDVSSINQFISEEANQALQRSQLLEGDILFSIAGTIGKTALVHKDCLPANTNQAVAIIRGTSRVFNAKYLRQNLRSSAEAIAKINARGGAMNNISLGDLKEIVLSVPPLGEQRQIAVKLDELLAQVDSIKTRLDAIPHTLKRFRQSVLASAVSGKLTEDWREKLCKDFSWGTKKLHEISSDISYGYTASSTNDPIGPKMLRITDIQDNKVDWNAVPYCEIKEHKKNNYLLKKDDLVFARTGATVGKSFLLKENPPESVYASYLIRVRCNPNNSIEYLAIFFQSDAYWKQITEFAAGIGQPNVNGTKLKNLVVPLPSLEEQTEIVRRVEQLFAYADQIEQRLKDAQARVNHLTQAILAKAFRGELTAGWRAQNHDLISGENSAESLLERIKAERKPDKSSGKTRKNRD
jgi:type I restriction enzyme S subunit